MLGAYAVVAPEGRFATQGHADLDRYVRWEYGGTMTVAALLAEATQVSEKSRTTSRRRVAEGIRALTKAFGAIAASRRSKIPTREV